MHWTWKNIIQVFYLKLFILLDIYVLNEKPVSFNVRNVLQYLPKI